MWPAYSDYMATATPLSDSTGGRAFASNAGGAIYAKNGIVLLVAADLVTANVLEVTRRKRTLGEDARYAGILFSVRTRSSLTRVSHHAPDGDASVVGLLDCNGTPTAPGQPPAPDSVTDRRGLTRSAPFVGMTETGSVD